MDALHTTDGATPGIEEPPGRPPGAATLPVDSPPWRPVPDAPRLTAALCELLREVVVVDEHGARRTLQIPAERPLTIFVDKRELVTLMTLGERPELLVLGWLCNQRLVDELREIESVTVDWEVGAAAVRTHRGLADLEAKTATRVVTTGCGQGTVFGDLMAQADAIELPDARHARIEQATLLHILETMRGRDSIHRRAGSVHGCALFAAGELLLAVEDVGRHNAVDKVIGARLRAEACPIPDRLLVVSGRVGMEIVQKALVARIPGIVSVGPPSSLAVELAQAAGMFLAGFVREGRLNRYDRGAPR